MIGKRQGKARAAVKSLIKKGKDRMSQKVEAASKRGRGRPRALHRTPDRDWFEQELDRAGYSQNEIARQMGKHGSLVSLTLGGAREAKIEEAILFSRLLNHPIDLILRKMGYDELKPPAVRVVGRVTGDASVSSVTAKRGSFAAPGVPAKSVAYLADTDGSALNAYHGAAFVVADPEETNGDGTFPLSAFGRLCIVEAEDHKLPLLGTLGKAPSRGAVTLTLFVTHETIALTKPLRASPVLAIIWPKDA